MSEDKATYPDGGDAGVSISDEEAQATLDAIRADNEANAGEPPVLETECFTGTVGSPVEDKPLSSQELRQIHYRHNRD